MVTGSHIRKKQRGHSSRSMVDGLCHQNDVPRGKLPAFRLTNPDRMTLALLLLFYLNYYCTWKRFCSKSNHFLSSFPLEPPFYHLTGLIFAKKSFTDIVGVATQSFVRNKKHLPFHRDKTGWIQVACSPATPLSSPYGPNSKWKTAPQKQIK